MQRAATQTAGTKPHFRPDIEGMRAVAVIAVVLFHIGLPGAAGGFVGVDVFYVISGFLITGLLLREIRGTGRIDIVRFYGRRIRRLLPAALLVIVVTTLASAVLLSSLRFPEVAGDAAAAALYVANIRFALEATDYLGGAAIPSPLLHYWSLAVEEQFYLFWPLLMLFGVRVLGLRRIGWLVASIAIVSFAVSLWWTDSAAPWAFFSLPTRAWELALGALIAVGILRMPAGSGERPGAVVAGLGLLMIVVSVVVLGPDTPYPGVAAVLPVLGAVLMIVGGSRVVSDRNGSRLNPSRWLSTAVPRWLGRISYSLYLWHWPLLILGPIAIGRDDLPVRVLLAGLAVGIAAVSTELIEQPIRREQLLRLSPSRSAGVGVAVSFVVAFTAVSLAGTIALPAPSTTAATPSPGASGDGSVAADLPPPVRSGPLPDGLASRLAEVRASVPVSYQDGCHLDFLTTAPPACVYGDVDSSDTVLLTGDSHAAQWLPALDRLAQDRGWRLVAVTKSACPAVELTVWSTVLKRYYRECDAFREDMLERIEQEQPSTVFVASAPMYEIPNKGGRARVEDALGPWMDALTGYLERIAERTPSVVLLADTPRFSFDPVECLAKERDIETCTAKTKGALDVSYGELEADTARAAGVEVLSINDRLCTAKDCQLVLGELSTYRDWHHVSAELMTQLAGHIGVAFDELPR